MYIKKHFDDVVAVCQPKDYIYYALTGKLLTDKYSWRGLANLAEGTYSRKLINELGLDGIQLPRIADFCKAERATCRCDFLPDGIPVYTGLNDYYASLLGMGITSVGDMFDITGTSEHIGIVEDVMRRSTNMVSGPYVYDNVHYGVTASSGASLEFGLHLCDTVDIEKSLGKNPPIFLPYLNGERAPVWDSDARGVFWGINGNTYKSDLAYSVFEGVVFSLYHIYEHMGKPISKGMKVSGGAANSSVLNTLKAELFDMPVITLCENDTSALGACIAAATGEGWYADIDETIKHFCSVKAVTYSTGTLTEALRKRFETYKNIYPAIRNIR